MQMWTLGSAKHATQTKRTLTLLFAASIGYWKVSIKTNSLFSFLNEPDPEPAHLSIFKICFALSKRPLTLLHAALIGWWKVSIKTNNSLFFLIEPYPEPAHLSILKIWSWFMMWLCRTNIAPAKYKVLNWWPKMLYQTFIKKLPYV